MQLQEVSFKLQHKDSRYLGCGIFLTIFKIFATGTTLPQKLNDVISERLIKFGFDIPEIENPELWIYHNDADNIGSVSLILNNTTTPIYIKTRFLYDETTLESDLYNIFQQWLDMYNLCDDIHTKLNDSFLFYKNITIVEDTDKIVLTISK